MLISDVGYRYEADHVYALATVYFCCAVIGLFTISNFLVRYSPEWLKRTRVWRGVTSISRYFSYRGYVIPKLRYWSPALGVLLLGVAGLGFFLGRISQWHQFSGKYESNWLDLNRNDTGSTALLLANGRKIWKQSSYCDSSRVDGSRIITIRSVSTFNHSCDIDEMLILNIELWVPKQIWFHCSLGSPMKSYRSSTIGRATPCSFWHLFIRFPL